MQGARGARQVLQVVSLGLTCSLLAIAIEGEEEAAAAAARGQVHRLLVRNVLSPQCY